MANGPLFEPQQQVPLNPSLLQQGTAAGAPAPIPGLPSTLGLFGGRTGGGSEDLSAGQFPGVFGIARRRRARKRGGNLQAIELLAKASGIEFTDEIRAGATAMFEQGFDVKTVAALLTEQGAGQQRAARVQRGRQGALSEFASAAGISQQAAASGAGFDRDVRSALEATARGEPGGRQALQAQAARSPRSVAERQNATDLLEQQLENSKTEGFNKLLTREGTLRKEVTGALGTSSDIVVTASQLLQLIDSDEPLSALGTVVKFARLMDPDSVVREGEVTTVKGGTGLAASLITRYNQLIGKGLSPEARDEFKNAIKALVIPEAQRAQRIIASFRDVAEFANVPMERVLAGSGIDEAFLQQLVEGTPFSSKSATSVNDL